jgi:hypothetical protein
LHTDTHMHKYTHILASVLKVAFMSIFESCHCIVKCEIWTSVCVVSQSTMDDIKVELDLHKLHLCQYLKAFTV